MKTKAVFCLGVASLAVAGCASLFGFLGGPATCTGPVCHVKVTVTNCAVTVDPDRIEIAKGKHHILWSIQPGGHHDFTSSGISFKTGNGTVFTNPHRPAVGKFQVTDFNDPQVPGPKYYKYTIEVTQDGKPCPPHDPDVMND